MISLDVNTALSASQHLKTKARPHLGALLVAGGGGKLGGEVVRRLTASVSLGRYRQMILLATEDFHATMAGVAVHAVTGGVANWPLLPSQDHAQTAIVMFEPPRMFYERERTIWTPHPGELPDLAKWLHASGVRHLVVVLPHQPGMLPEALQQGLANLDEQKVTSLGFERVVIMRMAQTDLAVKPAHFFERVANWILGVGKYMLPANQNPLRATEIAKLVEQVLQTAPAGHFVIPPSGELPKQWGGLVE